MPSLAALLGGAHEVALVVSQPDKVRSRRGRPEPTPVRRLALEHGVDEAVLDRGGRAALYERILALDPDVVVVVAFGHIVREPLLNGPRWGCVNVHASLLPRWRGPAPIHTAIVAGDAETGVCTMRLAEGVDTGDVYLCERTPIDPDETAGSLHDRLAVMGADVLVRTLDGLERGDLSAHVQPEEGSTYAPLLTKAEGSVDFDAPARRVHDRVRGLDPWPGVAVRLEERRLRLRDSRFVEGACAAPSGTVIGVDETGMQVACADASIRIGAVQLEGRRWTTPLELLRGRNLRVGDVLRPWPGFTPREPRV